jgi:sugar lactone lactonase YvrE
MQTLQAEPVFAAQNDLGEGPLWHPLEMRLYWVDITAGRLFRSDTTLSSFTHQTFEGTLGAIGFTRGGGFLLALERGFALWEPGRETPHPLWTPVPDRPGLRLNDGKMDPAGRFWAGSMDVKNRQGHLFCLDPDGAHHVVLDNIGISNGLGWSPDRTTMMYTDSLQHTIFAFDYDLSTGDIANRRSLVRLPKNSRDIVPDGLCVDSEGFIWSAQWNGGQVVRYDPRGKPVLTVSVPAQRPTSCCFGGENLDILFITSARNGLSPEALSRQPHAGSVFACQTNTTGQPATLSPLSLE